MKNRKKLLLGGLGIVYLVLFFLFGSMLFEASKKQKDRSASREAGRADVATAEPAWPALHDSATIWLAAEQFDKIENLEATILAYSDSVLANSADYAALASRCAQARLSGERGDPYALLLASEKAARQIADTTARESQFLELAEMYVEIGLHRRAFELIEGASILQSNPEAAAFETDLRKFLSRTNVFARHSLQNYHDASQIDDPITGRLVDLLVTAPANPWYDEFTVFSETEDSLLAQEAQPIRPFFLLPLLQADYAYMPNLDFLSEPFDVTLEDLALPDTIARNFYIAVRDWYEKGPAAGEIGLGALVEQSFQTLAPLFSSEYTEVENIQLQIFLHSDNVAVLSFWVGFETWVVLILEQSESGEVSAIKHTVYGLEEMKLLDVTGDGKEELFTSGRGGSGGFLDVTLIDLHNKDILLNFSSLYHGEAVLEDIDLDPAIEVILHRAIGRNRIIDCNQCPSLQWSLLYDYDAKSNAYRLVADRNSSSELLRRTHGNIMGLGPHMMYSMLGGQTIYALIDSMRNVPAAEWTDALLQKCEENYLAEIDILIKMAAYARATKLSESVSEILNRENVPDAWQWFRFVVYEHYLRNLFFAEEYEKLLSAAEQPWFKAAVDSLQEYTGEYYNVLGLTSLVLGDYAQSYAHFNRGLNVLRAPSERILGNMSLYFRSIGDSRSSYRYALQALDLAIQNGNWSGRAIDMIHLAASEKQHHDEKLEWLIRSLKISRALSSGNGAALALQEGAATALAHDSPELALALLDEAIAFGNKGELSTDGASLLFLYAKTLRELGKIDEAMDFFDIAAKLGETNRDPSVTINAQHQLSQMHYRLGNAAEALSYAQQAFALLSTRRKRIGEEPHKFSFLTDKEEIVSWYIDLLAENEAAPDEFLNTVETWKMQTFLDLFQPGAPAMRLATDSTTIEARLQQMLQPHDLFVDYYLTPQSCFALTVSKQQGAKFVALDFRHSELSALVNEVRRHMDIRSREAVRSIRKRQMPATLEAKLQSLYALLLAPIDIPSTTARLVISPYAESFGLPWPALLTTAGDYLIDRFEMTLTPSATIAYNIWLKRQRANVPSAGKALIVSALAPVSSAELIDVLPYWQHSQPGFSLPPLRSGWSEVTSVAGALEASSYQVRYLVDDFTAATWREAGNASAATPEQIFADAANAAIIHVTAHGIFNPFDPMQSCLFVQRGENARAIRAKDLAQLRLAGVELVTLAACQTGLSEIEPGSEPIGFLRALLGAGVSNVILTGWDVDDKATAELFSAFYADLRTNTMSQALRAAQQKTKENYVHPYFWAGVSLHGLVD